MLETTEIDAKEFETLSNRYSPDAEWEDLPPSIREYHMQQAYLEQLGDLCDKMEDVSLSQEQNHEWFVNGMYFVEAEMTEDGDVSSVLVLRSRL